MARRLSLEDDVARAFKRACRERDWEVAEFLFQALEAIAEREGDEGRMESALGELLEHLPPRDIHGKHRKAH
jgi:hypothetical protein